MVESIGDVVLIKHISMPVSEEDAEKMEKEAAAGQ
jgi:hypothetical protein